MTTTEDRQFAQWQARRLEERLARRGPFEDAWFPLRDITTDRRYAEMRIRQAKAWVVGDVNGYAPQAPREIMADLLTLLAAYRDAADQVQVRS